MQPAVTPLTRVRNNEVPERNPSYWDTFALTYHALRSPLVPVEEDLGIMETAVAACAEQYPGHQLQALLLGVTPTIARMRWPEGYFVLAVDRCEPMVRRVWPGDVPGKRQAVCGNWTCLPVARGSQHAVIADCAVNCVRYPAGLRDLAASIRDVLRSDGVAAMRCFVRAAQQETPEQVMADLYASQSFHHFKLRLLMALQESSAAGIAVNDVYRYWTSRRIDAQALAERTGWDRRDIDTIEMHNATNTVHTFPALDEICSVLRPHFRGVRITTPFYSLGERCPLLVLKP